MAPTQPAGTPSTTGQTWNTEAYATNGRFEANLATGVVELLAPQPRFKCTCDNKK